MGYDTRLYFCEMHSNMPDRETGAQWGEIVAMVEMAHIYDSDMEALIGQYRPKKGSNPKVYIYPDNDTREVTDKYGDLLAVIPVGEVADTLNRDMGRDPYRRFPPAYYLAKAFAKQVEAGQWENLVVVAYGH